MEGLSNQEAPSVQLCGGEGTLNSQNSLEQQPFHQDSHSVEDTLVLTRPQTNPSLLFIRSCLDCHPRDP